MISKLHADQMRSGLTHHPYIATVIDNDDPEQLNRVRARIPELHGDIADEHVPWAIQFRPTHSGSREDLGQHAVPRVGSKIAITHDRGCIYSPIYFAEPYLGNSTVDNNFTDYPNSYGFTDADSNSFHANMDRDTISVDYGGDVEVNVREGDDNTGSVVFRSTGSGYVRFGGKVLLEAVKDLIMEGQRRLVLIAGSDENDGEDVGDGPVGGTMVRVSGQDSQELVGRNKETQVEGDSQENVAGEKLVEAAARTATLRLANGRIEVYADDVRIGDDGAKALALYEELKAAFDAHRHALPELPAWPPPPPLTLAPARLTSVPKATNGVTDQGLPENVATTKAKGI